MSTLETKVLFLQRKLRRTNIAVMFLLVLVMVAWLFNQRSAAAQLAITPVNEGIGEVTPKD